MSGEEARTPEAPVPPSLLPASTSSLSLPTSPPKRFLGASPAKRLVSPTAGLTISKTSPVGQNPQPSGSQFLSPPKLFRIPKLVLTPVDITEYREASRITPESSPVTSPSKSSSLPPPPPLIKMPIFTRNEKRAVLGGKGGKNDGAESTEETEKRQEPPTTKRTRVTSESSQTSDSRTPRKIIQEIFGPDKSKRPKGKGRKKRRGPVTPKKKILTEESSTTPKAESIVDDEQSREEQTEEDQLKSEEKAVELSETDVKKDIQIDLVSEDDNAAKNLESATIKSEIDDDEECETASIASSSSFRRFSRRKAMVLANERLKRISRNGDGTVNKQVDIKTDVPPAITDQDEDDLPPVLKDENAHAGSIQSRRSSTTEGSSKSGSSLAQLDSESSVGIGMTMARGFSANRLRQLEEQRQRFDHTPLSMMSDDEDGKDEGVSVNDMLDQDHKDSDVDSTYSWKPVRAAAAAALEQVTKNQGSGGSTGMPGDAEAKAAAAAERRARKINRHKGRSRRTAMFKSSSSKKFTTSNRRRYSWQPSILSKVLYQGHYFQAGDIVYVELSDGSPMHGQIRGLLQDPFYSELSASIRFLSPKHPAYAFMTFEPLNYAFRYDIPERLIKIEYVNFIVHLPLDYFDGHPSFRKIEKNTVYTRVGKNVQDSFGITGSSIDSESDSSSSEDENGEKKEKKARRESEIKTEVQVRRRHLSDSSTDAEEENENDKPAAKTEEKSGDEDDEEEEEDDDNNDNDSLVENENDSNSLSDKEGTETEVVVEKST